MPIQLAVPGRADVEIEHAVFDINGTLAVDGSLVDGVEERVLRRCPGLRLHLASSDTFGTGRAIADPLVAEFVRVAPPDESLAKAEVVRRLGPDQTIVVGNGSNDALMLEAAALGIYVIGAEGAAVASMLAADIVVADVLQALDLLVDPRRLTATLRR